LSKGGRDDESTGLGFPRLQVGTGLAGFILIATNCRWLTVAKQAGEIEPNSGLITRYFLYMNIRCITSNLTSCFYLTFVVLYNRSKGTDKRKKEGIEQ